MPLGLIAQLPGEFVRGAFGLRPEDVGREPEVALALVGLHELADRLFEILEHFDFRGDFARRVGGDAHVFPFTTVRLPPA